MVTVTLFPGPKGVTVSGDLCIELHDASLTSAMSASSCLACIMSFSLSALALSTASAYTRITSADCVDDAAEVDGVPAACILDAVAATADLGGLGSDSIEKNVD